MMDVRVFNPNSPSYIDKEPAQQYKIHENEKKAAYNQRVQNIERGSFTPLIFTTTGGWGTETSTFHTRLAKLIAHKRNEDYHHVITYIRRRMRFSILRTTLVALRGCRFSPRKLFDEPYTKVVDIDLNLIEDCT